MHTADLFLPELKKIFQLYQSREFEKIPAQCLDDIRQSSGNIVKLEYFVAFLIENNDLDLAARLISMVIPIFPERAELKALMGHVCLQSNRLNEAKNYFFQASICEPENSEYQKSLKVIEDRLGKRSQLPGILFNTLPKSGSVYISHLLKDSLDLALMEISSAYFVSDVIDYKRAWQLSTFGGAIGQAHLPSNSLNLQIVKALFERMIVHVRDPRQALLSWLHQLNDSRDNLYVKATLDMGTELPDVYFNWDFSTQLDWMIQHFLPVLVEWLMGWLKAANSKAFKPEVLFTRYADFHDNPTQFYQKILKFYQLEPAQYPLQMREIVVGKMNFRKGQLEEWRRVYSSRQKTMAREFMTTEISEFFGWSKD